VSRQYWSKPLFDLVPYTPGEQPKIVDLIKLNTNENPYPPTPTISHILAEFPIDHLKRYPDPESSDLKSCLAQYHKIDSDNIFIGNGSDEVLAHVFMAFFRQEKPILMPEISYSFYTVYCNLYDIDYKLLPLAEDFSVSLEDYAQANGGIIFANPNAPTGRALCLQEIETLLKRNRESLVVVDEAYVDFGAQSAIQLTQQYDNCLVVQTLSKSRSLAAQRIGFAVGNPALIEGLERVKNSFNSYPLNSVSQKMAVAAYQDESYFQETVSKVINTRSWTQTQLESLGFDVIPSKTNFLFASHKTLDAAKIMQSLREKGIIVRHFSKPKINNYLRISIGTDDQMQRLIEALKSL
jgi:histidinol-phosphate aminotransferase